MYDIYYTTAGGPWFNSGADMWVTNWINHVAPHLDTKPLLLFHRSKPKNYDDFPIDVEHIWEIEEKKIDNILKSARKIHILHGHYTPTTGIYNNINNIDSIVFHNLTKISLIAQKEKDNYLHWYGDWNWENELINKIKNKIWIGLYKFPYETQNLHYISNYYEFSHNLELSSSTNIGFAARSEGRKNLEFIKDLESYMFTNSDTFNLYYREKYGYKFEKAKVYKFNHKNKEKFYKLDWGISHSCFEHEPFGYGIFEAVDWGKLPILHENWYIPLDYKYKAFDKESFEKAYKMICEDDYETRKKEFMKLKNWMIEHFSDKEGWKEKLLNIYNGL